MKNKLFVYAMIPALGLGFMGANIASAHWMGTPASPTETAARQSDMFQETATLLGISVEAIKEGWAEGKTISELARENGITDDQFKAKMEARHKEKMTLHLEALVAQGVITQVQADKRQATMESMKGNGKSRGLRHHMGNHDGISQRIHHTES